MRKSGLITTIAVLSALLLALAFSSCAKFMPVEKKYETKGSKGAVNEQIQNKTQDGAQDETQDETLDETQDETQGELPGVEENDKINIKDNSNELDQSPDKEEIAEGASEEDNFDYSLDSSGLSNESHSWSFKRNTNHQPVIGYSQGIDLEKYGAYYKVDTEEKVIYLTFDEGYENGYTSRILDILKDNDVQATFFVTKPYILSSTDLCIRMVEEGHIVANHSVTHSSFPTLSNEQIQEELEGTAQAFKEATGYEMAPFFRTPSGNYSERVLNEVRKQGYRSIFWSLAYKDWDVKNQPGAEFVYNHILENHHAGGIFLLHAVSESNTEALDDVLKGLKAEGYRFGSLYELD